jgi:RNA polymerase-binding transcription factor DksA
MTTRRAPEMMNKIELTHFETMLLDRGQALLKDVQAIEKEEAGTAGEVSGLSIHSTEFCADRSAHDVSLGCMESAIDEIQAIDDALDRLREGCFGICDMCGEKISRQRLEAIPYTQLCLSCKKAEEAF